MSGDESRPRVEKFNGRRVRKRQLRRHGSTPVAGCELSVKKISATCDLNEVSRGWFGCRGNNGHTTASGHRKTSFGRPAGGVLNAPERERTAGWPLTLMQTQRVGSEEARSGGPPPVRPGEGGISWSRVRVSWSDPIPDPSSAWKGNPVLKGNRELIHRPLPVLDRHRPFSAGIEDRQVEQFGGGFIGRKQRAVGDDFAQTSWINSGCGM